MRKNQFRTGSCLGALSLLACLACGTPEGTLTGSTRPSAASATDSAHHEHSSSRLVRTQQVNWGCPAYDRTLVGTAKPGQACSEAEACVPVCCRCDAPGNGAHSYLAVACLDAVCANFEDTCAASRSESVCPSFP